MKETFEQWKTLSDQLEGLENKADTIRQEMSTLAEKLREMVGAASFEHEGLHYQVRSRNGKAYMCQFKDKLPGRGKKRKTEAQEE